MTSSITRFAFYLTLFAFSILPTAVSAQMGPLIRSTSNPNYFARPNGTPVYLTGSHHWSSLQDQGPTFPPRVLNYTAYIDWMKANSFNFMRLWAFENHADAAWYTSPWFTDPMPHLRTGPGNAADGKPKFDLTKFNQAYFDRMRARVIAAGERGIYTAIMLYQGWSIGDVWTGNNPWVHHPFNISNNINNINGDPNGTGNGFAIHTTNAPAAILDLQKAYVRKVVDTVNDLDNVLYEIANESSRGTIQWQYDLTNYIKNYQAGKPKKHPIGMTAAGEGNANLFNSPADWISPNYDEGYMENPPANNGSKVILTDTDHYWGGGGDSLWVWKSFTRGLNPIFMDDLGSTSFFPGLVWNTPFDPAWYSVRTGMTQTAKYAARMDLRTAKPNGSLTSTTYMLADPGTQYLVLSPFGSTFTVNLSAGSGASFSVEWLNVSTGATVVGNPITGGSSAQSFTPPFRGSAVLFSNKII